MRNDQIFVLLLVILLPMSGCFDGAVGDAEGSDDSDSGGTNANAGGTNHPPVISAAITGSIELTEGSDCMTNGVQVEARHAMTDWDGAISQAGWDIDLDGTIDHFVAASEGFTMLQIPLDGMTHWNASSGATWGGSYDYLYRQQSVVFGAQDDAGEWTSSELFLIQITESYTTSSGSSNNYFDLEPCQDFEDVTQYTFNVTDHADDTSTGDTDYLVEITRTNGQAGIDWSRITIIVDGNNEGDEYCRPESQQTSNNRCLIYSGSGLTSTPTGQLWEAGETISLKEDSYLQSGDQQRFEVRILIDGIVVLDWYDYID